MNSSSSSVPLALLLLTTAAPGCNLSDKYCIGNCPEPSSDTDVPGDDTGGSLGGSDTGALDPTADTGDDDSTTAFPDPATDTGVTDATTGDPVDPPPSCELIDTIPASATCNDEIIQPGELCFSGFGDFFTPSPVSGAIAVPLDGMGTDILLTHHDHSVTAMLFIPNEGISAEPKIWPETFPEGDLRLTAVGDFNEDGFADVAGRLAGADGSGPPVVLLLDGAGLLLAAHNFGPLVAVTGPHLFDADGDSHLDLLFTAAPDQVRTLNGDGTGDFTVAFALNSSAALNPNVTGALGPEPDGVRDDIVFVIDEGLFLTLRGPGVHMLMNINLPPTDLVRELEVVDVQGDGLGDIVAVIEDTTTATSHVAVMLQSTGPGPVPEFAITRYPVRCGAVALAVGDIDGDDDLDLAIASPAADGSFVTVRRNDGDGGFADVRAFQAAMGPEVDDLFIVDLNADGAVEFATTSRTFGTFGVMFSTH